MQAICAAPWLEVATQCPGQPRPQSISGRGRLNKRFGTHIQGNVAKNNTYQVIRSASSLCYNVTKPSTDLLISVVVMTIVSCKGKCNFVQKTK